MYNYAPDNDGSAYGQLNDWHRYEIGANLELIFLGFPITLMVVFVLLFFSVSAFAESAKSLIENALFFVDELILGLRHGS